MRNLHGIRALDLTRLLSGDYYTLLLRDMEAKFIRVEETSLVLKRNKKSVKPNLKSEYRL